MGRGSRRTLMIHTEFYIISFNTLSSKLKIREASTILPDASLLNLTSLEHPWEYMSWCRLSQILKLPDTIKHQTTRLQSPLSRLSPTYYIFGQLNSITSHNILHNPHRYFASKHGAIIQPYWHSSLLQHCEFRATSKLHRIWFPSIRKIKR